jgi:hypothetical protein
MKKETATPGDRPLKMYALALLLAMFISALHAAILFSLFDFLELLHHWARSTLGGRPTDILVVLTAISFLFFAHMAEAAMWAAFFWKSGHLASFGDGWYFAGVSHTALGYGDVVLSKPGRSLAVVAMNGLLTSGVPLRPLPGAGKGLAPQVAYCLSLGSRDEFCCSTGHSRRHSKGQIIAFCI